MTVASPAPAPAKHFEPELEQATLRMRGELSFSEASVLWTELRPYVDAAKSGEAINFEMSGVMRVDGGVMALLSHVRAELQQRGVRSEFVGADPAVQQIIHLYRGDVKVGRAKSRKAQGTLDQIGSATWAILRELQLVLPFVGQMVLSQGAVVRSPRTVNWSGLAPLIERTGADAVPIVVLINFLVGLVMAFQSAVQLKNFGANIFIADLIGISVTRELGPLMTAIVVTGRSGAAFAAELGSMKVNEEIDALRTMGFGALRYLVLPRLLALMFVMPILVLLANVVAILGGLVVAITSLDLTIAVYFTELHKAVKPWDVYSGLIKSSLFGLAIGLISCQQGLATSGGAEGVGRRTTSAVVTTLFTLILIDAAYTMLFRAFDL